MAELLSAAVPISEQEVVIFVVNVFSRVVFFLGLCCGGVPLVQEAGCLPNPQFFGKGETLPTFVWCSEIKIKTFSTIEIHFSFYAFTEPN